MRAVGHFVSNLKLQTKRGSPDVSGTCLAAYVNLTETFSTSSCVAAGSIFAGLADSEIDGPTFQANVTSFCSNNCIASLKLSFTLIQASCSANNDIDVLQVDLAEVIGVLRLLCFTDVSSTVPGGYCLPVVRTALIALGDGSNGGVTLTTLNEYCQPCVVKFITIVASFGDGGAAASAVLYYSGLICMTDRDQQGTLHYCFLEFMSFANATDFGSLLGDICETHCLEKFIFYVETANVAAESAQNPGVVYTVPTQYISWFNFVCQRDATGKLCFPEILPILSPNSTATSSCNFSANDPTCPGACTTQINGLIKNIGCCFDVIIQLIAMEANTTSAIAYEELQALCGNQISALPPSCDIDAQIAGTVNISVTIQGIVEAWWTGNRADGEAALIQDLSVTYGIQISALTIVGESIETVNGSIIITLVIAYIPQSQNDGQSTTQQIQANGNIQVSHLANTVPFSGQSNFDQGVSANSQASYVSPSASTSSTSGQVSAFTQVSTAFVALLLSVFLLF